VATGRNFPDALAAGPAAALAGSPLLLIDGLDPDGAPESRAWLRAQADRLDAVFVVGGTQAVADDVADQVVEDLGAG
jgi:putative cell wall-binding protein